MNEQVAQYLRLYPMAVLNQSASVLSDQNFSRGCQGNYSIFTNILVYLDCIMRLMLGHAVACCGHRWFHLYVLLCCNHRGAPLPWLKPSSLCPSHLAFQTKGERNWHMFFYIEELSVLYFRSGSVEQKFYHFFLFNFFSFLFVLEFDGKLLTKIRVNAMTSNARKKGLTMWKHSLKPNPPNIASFKGLFFWHVIQHISNTK